MPRALDEAAVRRCAGLAQDDRLHELRVLCVQQQDAKVEALDASLLGRMRRLRDLDLSYNALRSLAGAQGARRLVKLNVSENRITELDVAVLRELPALEQLNLSGNRLERLPDLDGAVPRLQVLRLARNNLARLRDVDHLASLEALSSLTIMGNPMAESPHASEYVAFRLPTVDVLDGAAVPLELRKAARARFEREEVAALRSEVSERRAGERRDREQLSDLRRRNQTLETQLSRTQQRLADLEARSTAQGRLLLGRERFEADLANECATLKQQARMQSIDAVAAGGAGHPRSPSLSLSPSSPSLLEELRAIKEQVRELPPHDPADVAALERRARLARRVRALLEKAEAGEHAVATPALQAILDSLAVRPAPGEALPLQERACTCGCAPRVAELEAELAERAAFQRLETAGKEKSQRKLAAALEASRADAEECRHQAHSLAAELKTCSAHLGAAETANAQLESELEAARERAAAVQSDAQEAKKEREEAEVRAARREQLISAALRVAAQAMDASCVGDNGAQRASEERLDELLLQGATEELVHQVRMALSRFRELATRAEAARETATHLEDDCAALRAAAESERKRATAVADETAQLRLARDREDAELRELRAACEKARAQLREREAELAPTQDRVAAARSRVEELEGQIEQLQDEADRLRGATAGQTEAAAAAARARASEADKLAQANQTLKEAQARAAMAEKRIEGLKEQERALQSKIEARRRQFEEGPSVSELPRLRQDYAAVKAKLGAAQKRLQLVELACEQRDDGASQRALAAAASVVETAEPLDGDHERLLDALKSVYQDGLRQVQEAYGRRERRLAKRVQRLDAALARQQDEHRSQLEALNDLVAGHGDERLVRLAREIQTSCEAVRAESTRNEALRQACRELPEKDAQILFLSGQVRALNHELELKEQLWREKYQQDMSRLGRVLRTCLDHGALDALTASGFGPQHVLNQTAGSFSSNINHNNNASSPRASSPLSPREAAIGAAAVRSSSSPRASSSAMVSSTGLPSRAAMAASRPSSPQTPAGTPGSPGLSRSRARQPFARIGSLRVDTNPPSPSSDHRRRHQHQHQEQLDEHPARSVSHSRSETEWLRRPGTAATHSLLPESPLPEHEDEGAAASYRGGSVRSGLSSGLFGDPRAAGQHQGPLSPMASPRGMASSPMASPGGSATSFNSKLFEVQERIRAHSP